MKKWIVFVSLAGVATAAATPALACNAAGPDVHLGRVANVDVDAGEFTIKDFETGKFITFRADARLLKDVQGRHEPLAVKFHAEEAELTAVEIEHQ